MLTPAWRLRKAASMLSAAVDATTPGHWETTGGDLHTVILSSEWRDCEANVGSLRDPDDTHYITLVQPIVGDALAAWLTDEADRIETLYEHEGVSAPNEHALTIADTITAALDTTARTLP